MGSAQSRLLTPCATGAQPAEGTHIYFARISFNPLPREKQS